MALANLLTRDDNFFLLILLYVAASEWFAYAAGKGIRHLEMRRQDASRLKSKAAT